MMKKQGGSVKNVNKCITERIMVLLLAVMCIQAFFTINTKAADINNIGNLEYKVKKNPEQIYSLTNGEYHPIDYPYTMQGLGENVYVINVGIRAATGGLDLSTYRCDNHYVDFLAGHVGKECVKVEANCRNGILDTQWTTQGQQVPGQWYQVDMKNNQDFDLIVTNLGKTGDVPRAYKVKVSNDGTNWRDVASGENNNIYYVGNQNARYVRIEQTGNETHWWAIYEFYVLKSKSYDVGEGETVEPETPETTTPAPTTKVPETTTLAPTTKVPETTTPLPTTKEPETTTPAPTTKKPEITTPAPTTKKPEITTPVPTTKVPETTTSLPTTKVPETITSEPTTLAPTMKPETTTPAQTTQKAETSSDASTTVAPETKKSTIGRVKFKKCKKVRKKLLKLTWKKISYAKKYQIKISTSKKFKKKKTKTYFTKKKSFILKRLVRNKKYFIKARAVNKEMTGAWSKVLVKKIK